MRSLTIDAAVGKLINFFAADDVQKHQIGFRVSTASSDYSTTASVGNALGGEAMYVKASTTIPTGSLVVLDKDGVVVVCPTTANTGRPVYVALSSFSATALFGWVMRAGVCPVTFSVAATAGPVFVGTAGNATPTAAAGKQLLNATTLIAAVGNFTRSARTFNGRPQIEVADVAGIYPGITVTGTGIPASTTVLSIENGTRTIVLSANATASGQITATFTHTGFGIVHIEQPFVQGQIT